MNAKQLTVEIRDLKARIATEKESGTDDSLSFLKSTLREKAGQARTLLAKRKGGAEDPELAAVRAAMGSFLDAVRGIVEERQAFVVRDLVEADELRDGDAMNAVAHLHAEGELGDYEKTLVSGNEVYHPPEFDPKLYDGEPARAEDVVVDGDEADDDDAPRGPATVSRSFTRDKQLYVPRAMSRELGDEPYASPVEGGKAIRIMARQGHVRLLVDKKGNIRLTKGTMEALVDRGLDQDVRASSSLDISLEGKAVMLRPTPK
jgi:hypothetical protein